MAVGDFWRRALGVELTAAQESMRIPAHLLRGCFVDLAIGSGGITLAQARTLMVCPVGTDSGTEFGDLITSALTVADANANVQRAKRLMIADAVFSAIAIGERRAKVPSNPYPTGESVRLRAKAIVAGLGGTPSGTLAA
jgi:hypothetical protein